MSMLNIPEDKLPDEWKNKDRVTSLYSPFRSATVNPKDWDTKVASWREIIWIYCATNVTYSFTVLQLKQAFTIDNRPPSCLGVVVQELAKKGELQQIDEFMRKLPQDWGGWATDLLLKRPLSWSYNTIKRSLFSSPNAHHDTIYVFLGVVKQEAQKIIAQIPEKFRNKLINFEHLLKLLHREERHANDIKLLLNYLCQQQQADMTVLNGEQDGFRSILIKFSQNKIKPISEVDIGVYVLQQNETLFTKHVEDLEDEIAVCVKEVKQHLLKGHKQLAKTCLRKKHGIEKTLSRKVNALHNVQALLERVRDVHSDADVWQSYKRALGAFNTTFKETGLTEDAVEETMLKLGEVMDMHDDVQAAISRPVVEDQIDDDELEAELAQLVNNDDNAPNNTGNSEDLEKELEKLDLNFPNTPSASPTKQEISMG